MLFTKPELLIIKNMIIKICTLRWRHNDHPVVSNHQPHGCLLNRLFRRRWKKTSKLRVTGLCAGNSPGPVNSPYKGQWRGKCFHLMTSSWAGIQACSWQLGIWTMYSQVIYTPVKVYCQNVPLNIQRWKCKIIYSFVHISSVSILFSVKVIHDRTMLWRWIVCSHYNGEIYNH